MSLTIYVDTCIFVAYYDKKDEKRRSEVTSCLEMINSIDEFSLVTSDFTFTEFVKVMQNIEGVSEDSIFKIVSDSVRQKKIGKKYPFEIIDTEGEIKKYAFSDFFVGLQDILLDCRPGLADAIHYQIMMNNKIECILTYDVEDFRKIGKLLVVSPTDIEAFVRKYNELAETNKILKSSSTKHKILSYVIVPKADISNETGERR